MKPNPHDKVEVSLHTPDNVLDAIEIAMASFAEKVAQNHKPEAGAFFLGQGFWWSLALDGQNGILAAMAIREAWPLGSVTILMFEAAHTANACDESFRERGIEGFMQSIAQGGLIDDETQYPYLLGPFRFITGQIGACADQTARGHGNN